MERYVNDGSPSGWSHGPFQVSERYRPMWKEATFAVPVVDVARLPTTQWYASPHEAVRLVHEKLDDGHGLPIHPDLKLLGRLRTMGAIDASPTSSSRTVALRAPYERMHIKLHYANLLGRAPRELNALRVERSILVSRDLDRIWSGGCLPACIGYLPETWGMVVQAKEQSVGVLLREARPRLGGTGAGGADDGIPILLPLFAMFSQDVRFPEHPTLIEQLGRATVGVLAYRERLARLLIESFLWLWLRVGLLFEAHAQNLLVAVDQHLLPSSVVVRDFQDVTGDAEVRALLGLDTVVGKRSEIGQLRNLRSWHWDTKLGIYALRPVLNIGGSGGGTRGMWFEMGAYARTIAADLGYQLGSLLPPGERADIGPGVPRWDLTGPSFVLQSDEVLR